MLLDVGNVSLCKKSEPQARRPAGALIADNGEVRRERPSWNLGEVAVVDLISVSTWVVNGLL